MTASLRYRRTSGFTLVELLIVVVIIGILAGIALAALAAARQSARISKTEATIAKLHTIIMAKYESYRTRRVPIDSSVITGKTTQQIARMRLDGLRDLMRMEMPERWNDINDPPVTFSYPSPWSFSFALGQVPSLTNAWRTQLVQRPPGGDYDSAECLYMIVAANPDDLAQFTDTEIGDADGDGYREFIDGWGNPIKFLRWAPAFNDSDIQWNIVPVGDASQMAAAAKDDHDPFDVRNADAKSWRLMPLIYSAGPDGIYDISLGDNHFTWSPCFNSDGSARVVGQPLDSKNTSKTNPADNPNGSEDHYDNITNHRLGVR